MVKGGGLGAAAATAGICLVLASSLVNLSTSLPQPLQYQQRQQQQLRQLPRSSSSFDSSSSRLTVIRVFRQDLIQRQSESSIFTSSSSSYQQEEESLSESSLPFTSQDQPLLALTGAATKTKVQNGPAATEVNISISLPWKKAASAVASNPTPSVQQLLSDDKSLTVSQKLLCPDQKTSCQTNDTCCPLADGKGYGCCPYQRGNCCPDKIHCCPWFTVCDVERSKCVGVLPIKSKQLDSLPLNIADILKSSWGVSEEVHDASWETHSASQHSHDVSWESNSVSWETLSASQLSDTVSREPYGVAQLSNGFSVEFDGTSVDSDSTSEKVSLGVPRESDGVPRGSEGVPMEPNDVPRETNNVEDASNVCPNGEQYCAPGQTCCPLGQDEFGCCYLDNAVCCSDMRHCCPQGFQCDLANQRCIRNGNATVADGIPMVEKKPAMRSKNLERICPDRDSECKGNQTCCQRSPDGDYGCCPYSNAVCCSDGEHCCPSGTTCNTERGTCDQNTLSQRFMTPLTKSSQANIPDDDLPIMDDEIINCPNPSYQCYKGMTCCMLPDGGYGCCQFANATCCADKLHCCPHGTICDLESYVCRTKQVETTPAKALPPYKVFALPRSLHTTPTSMGNMSSINLGSGDSGCHGKGQQLCSDGQTCCETGDTCCSQSAHPWMTCCHETNGSCCPGGGHCCPFGFDCEQKSDGSFGCRMNYKELDEELMQMKSP